MADENHTDDSDQRTNSPLSLRRMNSITFAGLIMFYTAVGAFGTTAYFLYTAKARDHLIQYAPEMFACGIGVFVALLGVRLVRAGGLSPSDPLPVVNPREWSILSTAITDNKDDPIGQYIRLSSLTGATGLFTKLGLSGLPLATIGLTIFFAVISLYLGRDDERFYQLTQITLGAFVGSFVQKQVGALREAAVKPAAPLTEAEKAAQEKAAQEKAAQEKAAQEQAAQEQAAQEEQARQDAQRQEVIDEEPAVEDSPPEQARPADSI